MDVQFGQYDVVIVGGGGAGIATALNLAGEGARVAVLSKQYLACGDTRISEGILGSTGISPGDSPQRLVEDMLAAGDGLNQRDLVEQFARQAHYAATDAEQLGNLFRRDGEGKLSEAAAFRSGGHSFPRGLTSSPAKGLVLAWALRSAAARGSIDCLERMLVYRVLTSGGKVLGILALSLTTGEIFVLRSPVVVLASGGGGWLYYPDTDCTREQTGDGYALGLLAGAELVEMEQVQFIPFAIASPESMRGIFVGEPAGAGPGGVLRDRDGKVILDKISRKSRSQVTQAMGAARDAGRAYDDGSFMLDLTANRASEAGRKLHEQLRLLGWLDAVRIAYGMKAARWEEPFPVAPSAHYFMGGLRVNTSCETAVPGLYAVGQAQGGLHGGGRLGAASLSEMFTHSRACAAAILAGNDTAGGVPVSGINDFPAVTERLGRQGKYTPGRLMAQLQAILNNSAGMVRNRTALTEALAKVEDVREKSNDVSIPGEKCCNIALQEALELELAVITARAILKSALTREESRGAHFRSDYPDRAEQVTHTVSRWEGGDVRCVQEGVVE